MRFIITARPSDNGQPPRADAPIDLDLMRAHMRFNEEMYKAGVLVACEGLNPGGHGARVEVRKGRRAVVDGQPDDHAGDRGATGVVEVEDLREEGAEGHEGGGDRLVMGDPLSR